VLGNTTIKLSEKYKLHRSTIQSILIRNNIDLRLQNITARKYKLFNEDFFNEINNEESSYVLGLLFADGTINKNGFELCLMEDDVEMLEKISNIFYNKRILTYRNPTKIPNTTYISKGQYKLSIVSHKIKNDLIKHGCIRRKSLNLTFPKLIDETQYRHFIRGYFDGDGSIFKATKRNYVGITITSTINFCDDLSKYLHDHHQIHSISSIRYNNVGYVRIHKKNDVIRFIKLIYDNSKIHLKRKYLKSQSLINDLEHAQY